MASSYFGMPNPFGMTGPYANSNAFGMNNGFQMPTFGAFGANGAAPAPQLVDPKLIQEALTAQNQMYGNWAAFLGTPQGQLPAIPEVKPGDLNSYFAAMLAQQQTNLMMWQGIVGQSAGLLNCSFGLAMASLGVNDVQAQFIDGWLGSNTHGWMTSGLNPVAGLF